MSSINDQRRIRDVRDIWNNKENPSIRAQQPPQQQQPNAVVVVDNLDNRTKHKYKTLERHLSMKKTIRKKMMRDLREIGGGNENISETTNVQQSQQSGFLDQIKNDQPPPPNIDKPSLWKRLKGWGGYS